MEYKNLLAESKRKYDLGVYKIEVPDLFQEIFLDCRAYALTAKSL